METQLDQAIQEIICKVYKAKYTGSLKVKHIEPEGYEVIMGLGVDEKPLRIFAQLPFDKFLIFIEKELRDRHLHSTSYYTGYKNDQGRTYRIN